MISSRTLFILFNFIGFQIVWAACAYGAINQLPFLGVVVGIIYILIHFIFSPSKQLDLIIMFVVAITGIILDTANLYIGLLSFGYDTNMLPFWLAILWFSFSLILPHSLYWLSKFPLLAVIFGGLGGAGTYYIGHQLGAISLSTPLYPSLIAYCLEWAIIVPAALWLISMLNKSLEGKSYARSS
ncbi:MAG: DUF2878 domain-containing protein [Pseudomonadota bacterium]